MNNFNFVPALFQGLIGQLPVLLVALVACIVTILNWSQSPNASIFSLLGFGITLALCILGSISSATMQYVIISHASDLATYKFVFTAVNFFLSLLRAGGYALILAAIYVGRQQPAPRPATTTWPPQVSK